jgi:hypothetical protein
MRLRANSSVLTSFGFVVVFIISVTTFFSNAILNNMGLTENRAYAGANKFIEDNKLVLNDGTTRGRLTCAGDSDPRDGYGSCTIVDSQGNKIYLMCPTDFIDVYLWRASSCKEIESSIMFNTKR